MAVCLSGLPGLPVFDAIGEPATHAQRWITWRAEFELYVTASGITQLKRELFYLHLPDSESEISSTAQFLLMFAAELKTMKKLEQLIGILQTKKERSNGKTELFSGKTIGW